MFMHCTQHIRLRLFLLEYYIYHYISVDEVLHSRESCNAVFDHLTVDGKLRNDCKKLCEDFPELWKPGLGCLKDVELEVEFKKDAMPVFCKESSIPRAIQDDLEKANEEGIAKGTWGIHTIQ